MSRKQKTRLRKTLTLVLSAVLLVAISVGVTIAYLTDTASVKNTFTVGNVKIKLDEVVTKEGGWATATPAPGASAEPRTETGNSNYKIVPSRYLYKDPTVTLLKGSEPSYIKMTVTVNKCSELDAIGINLTETFDGYEVTKWFYQGNTKNTEANTRTYTFYYKGAVEAPNGDVKLPALFKGIKVPETLTNEQLATLEGLTITVNAYAIQAEGFDSADAAWAAYDAQNP